MNDKAPTDDRKVYMEVPIQGRKNQLNNFLFRAKRSQLPQWEAKLHRAQKTMQESGIARLREESKKREAAYNKLRAEYHEIQHAEELHRSWQVCEKQIFAIESPVSDAQEMISKLETGMADCKELLAKVERIGKAALEAQEAHRKWVNQPFKSNYGDEPILCANRTNAEMKWKELEAKIEKLFVLL